MTAIAQAVRAVDTWVWISLGLAGLVVVNLSFAADSALDASETSYGKAETGFGAVHDLLRTLHPSVARSRRAYTALSTKQPLWLIQPDFLRGVSESPEAGQGASGASLSQDLIAWLARGGTALVFGSAQSDWRQFGVTHAEPSTAIDPTAQSTLGPRRRFARDDLLLRFAAADEVTPVVTLNDGWFVARKSFGRGTLIAVADARPFDNGHLALADHSNLAVDLARAYGAPLFDEYCHGFVEQRSVLEALGRPRATLLGTAFALWALLLILHLRRLPAAKLAGTQGPEPGLANFVEPLAVLYSRKAPRYAAAVYRAYLHGVRFRLRRLLHGSGAASDAALERRLERDLAHDSVLRETLQGTRAPADVRELEDAVSRLERYVASVMSTHGTGR